MMSTPGHADPGRDQQYLAYAEAYTEAAKRLAYRADDMSAVRIPFFQLVAHAIELMLKAVLSRQGHHEERLMMMGHWLERCHVRAIEGGAAGLENEEFAAFMEALDRPHAMQAFRYPQWFDWPMLEPAEAMRLLSRQLDIVRDYLVPGR